MKLGVEKSRVEMSFNHFKAYFGAWDPDVWPKNSSGIQDMKELKLSDISDDISGKVEKILNSNLGSIPSLLPSVKIQIMSGKVCLRCKGKPSPGVVNRLLKTKSLLTSPSNVLFNYLI